LSFFGRLPGRSERELKQLDTNFRRLKDFFYSLGYLYRLVDLQVQGGGAVWHRGGADSKLDKVGVLILPKMGLPAVATEACAVAHAKSLLDR
jgi:hypothetical protein